MNPISIFSLCLILFLHTASPVRSNAKINQEENLSDFERNIIREINAVRKDQKSYVPYLQEYEKRFRGKILYFPGRTPFLTVEGFPVVQATIDDLNNSSELVALGISNGLVKVAENHFAEISEDPSIGHYGKDGSNVTQRMRRVGSVGRAGENITFLEKTPRGVVLKLLIDDGVKTRQHRRNILDPQFKLIGVACGDAVDSKFICVIEFASTFVEGDGSKQIIEF